MTARATVPMSTPGHAGAPPYRLVDAVIALRYALLGLIGVLLVLESSARATIDSDWQFFTWGGDLLFGEHHTFVRASYTVEASLPGGLDLYAHYPFLQIGPPSLLAGKLIEWGPRNGLLVSGFVVQGLSLLFLLLLERAFPVADRTVRLGRFAAAACVTLVWSMITHYRHLDDAITLTALAAAALALKRDRPVVVGLWLGLAAAAKPWGIPLVVLALALPNVRRLTALAVTAATAAAFWGPFVIADRGTLNVGRVQLYSSPESPLSALGVVGIADGGGVRLAQFGIGLILAALLVARGSWYLAPVVAFAFRLGAETAAYPYYAGGAVAAACLADVVTRRRLPAFTLTATAGWAAAALASGRLAGGIRLVDYGALVIGGLWLGLRRRPREPPAASSRTASA